MKPNSPSAHGSSPDDCALAGSVVTRRLPDGASTLSLSRFLKSLQQSLPSLLKVLADFFGHVAPRTSQLSKTGCFGAVKECVEVRNA